MENLTVVSTIFWPWILGNLSMVSIFFFEMKNLTVVSNIFLAVHFSQAIHSLNLVFKWKVNRCFNNFLALDFRESMNSFNFVFQ